ncbi:flowering time control protein FCA-like isoform X2 [Iris pallida]|uniref:Flowering time control protein FCA-like isoform X2 n=1 Tax=Iris pallida TaxID=29817 RepID=A0AAX6GZP4_IRIPA|nr:flowering time control protein FCA-like isoform X2 [Iris pallida]
MAAAAMNALHGTYTMRGCDQPLIVRFADPKRPRPDPRGGPAFGGPGFGHRSEDSTMIRPPSNYDVPMGGRLPPNAWGPVSPQPNGPSSLARNHGFHSNSSAKGGGAMESSSPAAGSFGDTGGPASGSQPNLAATPLSQQGFNPPMVQTNPAVGQQMPPLQKPDVPSQHLPASIQPHNNQNLASYSQGHAFQAPMQQFGQLQVPHSIGLPSSQTVPSQQLPGLAGQLSISQPLIQQNASASGMQNQLGIQQQGMAAVANQQQMPASTISHQLLQRPVQQLPSQFPQALLQQQAQALQSSYQSSQQALFQLQQQVHLMQQSSQQQLSQNAKQQSTWSGPQTTSSTPVSTASVVMPSSATSAPVTTASAAHLTCNWTEHTSPEGFKYYYNSVTSESKWEKPEEYLIFEQQQQQQKMLLLQQQQQKLAVQQLQSPSQTTPDSQVQRTQQVSQTQQQVMSQMQLRQQAQLQLLHPSLAYQAPGAAGNQSVQGFNYAQLQAVAPVTDPARHQQGQGVQATSDSWQTKPAGS